MIEKQFEAILDHSIEREAASHVVLSAAQQIIATKDRCNAKALRTLMLFTHDLDAGTRQSFRQVHGELLDLLQLDRFLSTNERLHAAA